VLYGIVRPVLDHDSCVFSSLLASVKSVKCRLAISKHIKTADTTHYRVFNVGTLRKFHSCYNKCLKRFFGFPKYNSSLTAALMQTGLPSSSTAVHNFTYAF